VNGLSLLIVIALAIGIVVAYRAGMARGARENRSAASLVSPTSPRTMMPNGVAEAPATADAARAMMAIDEIASPVDPAPADAAAQLAQAQSFAEERYALHRALADARGETARYRQLVIDLENDAPPPLLDSPGTPDDLKLIVGVGPVLERMLQQLGISRYRQIARWSERDIDEFDARLPEFPGRIRRDEWVTQARALHQSKYGEALPPRDRA
jgi:predicted flap endonuclease-1-like 5' DNA nuclease